MFAKPRRATARSAIRSEYIRRGHPKSTVPATELPHASTVKPSSTGEMPRMIPKVCSNPTNSLAIRYTQPTAQTKPTNTNAFRSHNCYIRNKHTTKYLGGSPDAGVVRNTTTENATPINSPSAHTGNEPPSITFHWPVTPNMKMRQPVGFNTA